MHMTSPIKEEYWFRRRLMRYTDRRYDHLCSQSQWCTGEWRRQSGVSEAVSSYVWNAADLARFDVSETRPLRAVDTPFRLVSVGRLHPMKAYHHVVEAVHSLGDERVTLDILGCGSEEGRLRDMIGTFGLVDRVRLRGHVEDPEAFLKDADCFVLASTALESCPAVLAEAMAARLPLVTSDFGPLAEVNLDGITGLVVPAGDSDALAGAIRTLADNPLLAQNMGDAGYRRAHEGFSVERMVTETLARYKGLLSDAGRA